MSWLHPEEKIPLNRICTDGVIETGSRGIDEYWRAIGSTSYPNSVDRTRILIPEPRNTPGPAGSSTRYVIRLAAHRVPPGRNVIVHGVRQYLDIGVQIDVGRGQPYILNQPIISPFWTFSDAIVTWHLVQQRTHEATTNSPGGFAPSDLPPGWSQELDSTNTGLIALNPFQGAGHQSLLLGEVPGTVYPLDSLGSFSDIRFPWISSANGSLGYVVEGNSIVALYATVLQTDPDTRPVLPAPEDIFSLNQEERFILANPNARYWSIAGSLILQEVPST